MATTQPTAKKTPTPQRAALEAVRREVIAGLEYPSTYPADEIGDRFYGLPGLTFSARCFGSWVNPPDAEDEEDCDHMIPTSGTVARLDAIVAAVAKRFPGVRLTWSNQEKCYVSFDAE